MCAPVFRKSLAQIVLIQMAEHGNKSTTNSEEPYEEVWQLFSGDLHRTRPTYSHRDEWVVISPEEIRHVDAVNTVTPIGTVAIGHVIMNEESDRLRLRPDRRLEFDRYVDEVFPEIMDCFDRHEEWERRRGLLLG